MKDNVYSELLELAKRNVRELLQESAKTYSWLLTSEEDKALGEIAIVALSLSLKAMPIQFAIAFAIKAYSEKLEGG